MQKNPIDHYQDVTTKIVQLMEDGKRPWDAAWTKLNMPLRSTGEAYRGINILLLDIAMMVGGYDHNVWCTYKQALALGGQVAKGSKGTRIYKTGSYTKTIEDGQGNKTEEVRTSRYLKSYTVFNIDQIDGLTIADLPFDLPDDGVINPDARNATCEAFFASLGGELHSDSAQCFYRPGTDTIHMVAFEQFHDAERYYSVLAHEYTHWTMHPRRLDRPAFTKFMHKTEYAKEELVAELGAAFLCRILGLSPEPREDHAAYLQSWLKVLKDDKRAIFRAAAQAQKAVDYLRDLSVAAVTMADAA